LSRFQQTIKEQALTILNLNKDIKGQQAQLDQLTHVQYEIQLLNGDLEKRAEQIKLLNDQSMKFLFFEFAFLSILKLLICVKLAQRTHLSSPSKSTSTKFKKSTSPSLTSTNSSKLIFIIYLLNNSINFEIKREMIKNLIIGYIKVTQTVEKKQVLKMIGTLLNFSPAELEMAEHSGETRWLGFLKGSSATPSSKTLNKNLAVDSADSGLNKSFTELLIQYVDRESKPKPNLTFDLSASNAVAAASAAQFSSVSQTPPGTNKKTDSVSSSPTAFFPVSTSESTSSQLLTSNGSASAIKFFNNSLIGNNPDLVNRSSNQIQPTTTTSAQTAANQFLDQILK
jgi:hypothetical protein